MRAANEEEATTRSSLTRKQASAYQGAFEAVLAVPLAVGFGYWAGGHLGSSTTGVVLGAVIGFAAMVLRLTRMRPSPEETGEAETETGTKGVGSETTETEPENGSAENGGPMIGFGLFGEDDEQDDEQGEDRD